MEATIRKDDGRRVTLILDGRLDTAAAVQTEKDMQRLRTTSLVARLQQQGKRLIALPIWQQFYTPKETFDRQVLTYVRENCRR